MRTLARVSSLVSLFALAACGAPSSFDGLTGGKAPPVETGAATRSSDVNVAPPRQLSPISVSLVSTLRPRFSWELAEGTTGAVVEVCRSRACDGPEVRRFDADGRTLTLDEDLEPGIWYWRTFGMNDARIGTTPSATWELLVRGPAKNGSSELPSGGLVDLNGDGYPDLVVTSDENVLDDDTGEGVVRPGLHVFIGKKDGRLEPTGFPYVDMYAAPGEDALAGAVDTDGDGFPDVIHAVKDVETNEYFVVIEHGTEGKPYEGGVDYVDMAKAAYVDFPGATELPAIREGGDVNGDGFGDVLVAASGRGVIGLGSAKGTSATMPFLLPFGGGETTRALIGAFDADGDGLSDLAYAGGASPAPITAARGDRDRIDALFDLTANAMGAPAKAIAMVTGDFDGDGALDVAATVPTAERRAICFWLAAKDKLFENEVCVPGPRIDPAYGAVLTTADLEGDGRDEVLVSTGPSGPGGAGVEILALDGQSVAIDRVFDVPALGPRLTTLWPGRPGKARWAATSADGRSILVFEGRKPIQTLTLAGADGFAAAGFARAIR